MVASSPEYAIALAVFERVRESFPALTMVLDREPEHVDLRLHIPSQPGLVFDLDLNLQNRDELHLAAGALWVEWFPCTRPDRQEAYIETVVGLLSGRFRILEHRRGRRPVKAELQRPMGEGWQTIATWATWSLPWPKKTFMIVRNVGPT
jgi:hypothetical protein